MDSSRHTVVALATALALTALAGCSESVGVGTPVVTAPVADGPVRAIEALRWAHEHRDVELYRTLFTEDFAFVFAAADSAGSAWRAAAWRREDELLYGQHLFVGGSATEEPARDITLDFGSTPVDLPDPRPGHDAAVHRRVAVEVALVVLRQSGNLSVEGTALFFVTRGDSARVPGSLPADSTRWYIDRWEDATIPGAGSTAVAPVARPMPADPLSWGRLKLLYH